MRKSREFGLFKDVPDELWNDWHWQVKNRSRDCGRPEKIHDTDS